MHGGRDGGLTRAPRGWAALVLGCLVLTSIQVSTPAAAAERPVRILLVGDSVTQGSAGDWTWRYRLWQHFQDQDVSIDFVGPRDDLYEHVAEVQGSQAYVDPAFDRDHAARWGMMLEFPDVPIAHLVAEYDPDVVVEMLGVNDLYWRDSPQGVLGRVEAFVDEARSAKPTVELVLSEAPQIWREHVPEFNAGLAELAPTLDTAESPLVVADVDAGFDEFADTWDRTHPNARGEMKIAAGVADALSVLGVGAPADRPVPRVPLGPRMAPDLTATPGNGAARLRWSGAQGATGEYVWVRDRTLRERWHRLAFPLQGSTWVASGLTNGHRYAFRLQPVKGSWAAASDVRSGAIVVVPQQRPARPRSPLLEVRLRGLLVAWSVTARATSYEVTWWPTGHPLAARTRSVEDTSTRIGSLVAGRRYSVTVRARNAIGWGPVSNVAKARAGGS